MQTSILALIVGLVGTDARATIHTTKPKAEKALEEKAKEDKPKAGLDGFGLTFEIRNYDYFGMTDEWSDPWADDAPEAVKPPAKEIQEAKKDNGDHDPLAKVIDELPSKVDWPEKGKGDKMPWPVKGAFVQFATRACWRASDALVKQIVDAEAGALTMMDATRTAIKSAIEGAITCEREAAEAKKKGVAVKAKASLLSKKATMEKPKEAFPNIHVTFRPGTKTPTLSLLAEKQATPMLNKPRASLISTQAAKVAKTHWSVIVDVVITDEPNNGANDLKETQKLLKKAVNNGQLKDSLRGSLYQVTGNEPDIRHVMTESSKINQWDVGKCEKHISKIVNMFTLHYTRAQVPMALYNECTNFMPKMSFSRDHILDSRDAHRCRKATAAFQKLWKYGKNAEPKDFQVMCLEACEAKYGKNAPLCHVTEGKKLKDQPKL